MIVVAVAVWEIIGSSGMIHRIILAPPSRVVTSIWSEIVEGRFYYHVRLTLIEVGVAYGLGIVFGLTVGCILGLKRSLRKTLDPFLDALFSLPKSLFYPMIIIWFGVALGSKIAFGFLLCIFPVITNTISGIRTVDTALLKLADSLGLSSTQKFFKVIFPAALPTMVAGLRMGLSLTFIGVITGEVLASLGGIGYAISWAATVFHTGDLYGYICIVVIFGVIINQSLMILERKIAHY